MTEYVEVLVEVQPHYIEVEIPAAPAFPDALRERDIRRRVSTWDDLTDLNVSPFISTAEALRRDTDATFPMPAVFRNAGIIEPDHPLWRRVQDGRYFEYIPPGGMVDISQVGVEVDRDAEQNADRLREAAVYASKKKAGLWCPPHPDFIHLDPDIGQTVLNSTYITSEQFLLLGGGMWQTKFKRSGDAICGFMSLTERDKFKAAGFAWFNEFGTMPAGVKPTAFRVEKCNDFEFFDIACLDSPSYGFGLQTQTGTFKRAYFGKIRIYRCRLDGVDLKDEANGNEEIIFENIYLENHSYDRGDADGAGLDLRCIARVNGVYCKMTDNRAGGYTVRTRPPGFEDLDDNDETPVEQDNEGGRKSIITNVHTIVTPGLTTGVGSVALAGPRSRASGLYAEYCTLAAHSVGNGASMRDAEAWNCAIGFNMGAGKGKLKDFEAHECAIGLRLNDDCDARVIDGLIEDGVDGVTKEASLDRVYLRNIESRNNSNSNWPATGFAAALGVTVIDCPGLRQSPSSLTYGPANSKNIGSVPAAQAATITVREEGNPLHETVLTFVNAIVPLAVAGNGKAYGSINIYDLIPTVPTIETAVPSFSIEKSSAGVVDDWEGDFAIGTAASDGNGTLENLEISVMPETATTPAPNSGADRITNGAFASGASWTTTTGWTITGGKAVHTPDPDPNNPPVYTGALNQAITVTANSFYRLTYTISDRTQGTVTPRFTGGSTVPGTTRSANGAVSEIIKTDAGNNTIEFIPSEDFDGKIDDVVLIGVSRARGSMTTRKTLGGASGQGSANKLYLNFLVDVADHTVGTTPANLILNGPLTLTWISAGDWI